jgi:PST family polysaccharide transporter
MNDNTVKTSANSLKFLFTSQFINIILGFIRSFLFTLYLAPENFGLLALSTTFTGLIYLLKEFGYSTYIIQKQDLEQAEIELINTRTIILGVIAFGLICIMTVPIVMIYKQHELLWILPIIASQFIFSSLTVVPFALLKKTFQFNKIAIIEVGSSLFSIVSGVVALFFIRDYWVLLISSIAYFIFQMVATYKTSKFKISFTNPYSQVLGKESNYFGTRLTLFNVLTFISVNVDNILIAKLFGNTALGIYSKSYEFGVTVLEKIKNPLQQVYFSDIALMERKRVEMYNSFLQYVFLLLTILSLIIGPLLITMNFLIDKFLSAGWSNMKSILPPFLISSFIWMVMSLADQLLIVSSKLRKYLILGSLKAGIGFSAIIIASIWQIDAIAWSFLIYHIILFVPYCYYILLDLGFAKNVAKNRVAGLTIIVFSACIVVTLPWVLIYYGVLSWPICAIIFLLGMVGLHFAVWPRFQGYKSFLVFLSGFKFLSNARIK